MRWIILLLAAVLVTTACGDDDQAEGPRRRPAARRTAPPRVTYPEPAVGAILQAIDSTRIAAGVAVRDRSQNAAVLEYARVMRIDHRAMRAIIDSVLRASNQAPAANAVAQELRASGDQFLSQLMALDSGFNTTYLAQEISDHERAIVLLDTVLLRSARTPALKQTLERLRPAYIAHLQRARAIMLARQQAVEPRPAETPTSPAPVRPDTPRPRIDTPRVRVDTLVTTTSNQ